MKKYSGVSVTNKCEIAFQFCVTILGKLPYYNKAVMR